ncbi:hypothetical protein ANCDUO_12019 [Ancylostoma duodenale]|uniref:Eukaryotic translation initiation factor 3 subunit C N-terminal domain-containing protein n=1 Tax=Ancylostoma duodenale TaxID=51022 RepID=A0A0C2GL30_9BILA|nr:hypothetical protein ANCDUO_12019 [Ancylostoma duodenale]
MSKMVCVLERSMHVDSLTADETMQFNIQGSFLMMVQRLDRELTKILQNADSHPYDYIEKLNGEKDMCILLERTEKYVQERIDDDIFDVDGVCSTAVSAIITPTHIIIADLALP